MSVTGEIEPIPERRVMVLSVPTTLLAAVLSGRVVVRDLPAEIHIRHAQFNLPYDAFELLVEHPSFAPVAQGDMAPMLFVRSEVLADGEKGVV